MAVRLRLPRGESLLPMIPAVSYLRMSKESQDTSIPAQRKAIAALAKAGGYKIIREYVDSGISGDATEKRLEFQRMMADVAKSDFKAVLCWDQDRFGRFDPLEAGFWIKPMRDAGIVLVTVAQGKIDWTEFAGRILYTIQQEGKHQFLRDLSRNVNRGKMQAALDGRWMGGAPPYGYTMDTNSKLVIREDEAAIVREIFRLYLTGMSYTRIRKELNDRAIPSPEDMLWSSNTVGRMLQNPAYIGHVRYNQRSAGKYTAIANGVVIPKPNAKDVRNDKSLWIVVENAHPPIVNQATFDRAQAERAQHRRWTGSNRQNMIMFKALLTCGHCGYAMHASWVPAMEDVVYQCSHHWVTGGCEPNRTYQTPLLKMLQDTLQTEMLSPKAIATARRMMAASDRAKPVDEVPRLTKQEQALRAKVEKAQRRLVEVDADLVATVSGQLRILTAQHAEVAAALQEARRPVGAVKSERNAQFEDLLERYRQLVTSMAGEPSEALQRLLQKTIETIKVTSIKEHHTRQPNGKYRIAELEIIAKKPEISRS